MRGAWRVRSTLARGALEVKRAVLALRLRLSGPELHVEYTNPAMGFFAQVNFCLYIARYAQAHGKTLFITMSAENYREPDDGGDWFHSFFAERHGAVPAPGRRRIRFSDSRELPRRPAPLSLDETNDSFFQAYRLRGDINAAVDALARRWNIGPHSLGVHFRGTDKSGEAEPISHADAIDKIGRLVAASPQIRNLFVASDDAHFIRHLAAKIHTLPVVWLDDSVRSEDGAPVHIGGLRTGNLAIARDALMNALMLARCGKLVRTTSLLSAWASVFNPALEVTLLNRPKPGMIWYPEALILPRARFV